MNTYNTENL